MMQRKEKQEECDVDNTAEAHTIYEDEEVADCDIHSQDEDDDEDEDYECNEIDKDLYDSKLDEVDEVIFFRDSFFGLQTNNPQMYGYYLGCLDQNEQNSFNQAINKAIEF